MSRDPMIDDRPIPVPQGNPDDPLHPDPAGPESIEDSVERPGGTEPAQDPEPQPKPDANPPDSVTDGSSHSTRTDTIDGMPLV